MFVITNNLTLLYQILHQKFLKGGVSLTIFSQTFFMRIEAQYKMGYYPTPTVVVSKIRSFIKFPETTFTALDPCCGCGTALHNLLSGTQGIGYGIELDGKRYKQAKKKLYRVAKGGYEVAKVSNDAFAVLFLNPPYDYDANGQRKEKIFLQDTQKYLMRGGLLIYIIPQNKLTADIAKIISYRFSNIRIYRFPGDEYDSFGQIVLFGIKKSRFGIIQEDVLKMVSASNIGKKLEELPFADEPLYSLLPSEKPKIFVSGVLDEEELEEELENSSLWNKIKDMIGYRDSKTKHPPLPLHQGHIGLLLASGYLNGEMKGHLIKGEVIKKTVEVDEETDDGVIHRETDVVTVSVKVLTNKGEIYELM